jgi:hypothetical protein
MQTMTFKKIFNGRALYVDNDVIWVAKGLCFYAIDYNGKRVTRKYNVGSIVEKVISSFRLSRQLLRFGIHHLIPLANGSILVILKKKTLTISKEGVIKSVFSGYKGNKPGHRGVCITPNGSIFFGEYSLNMNRQNETKLYRSVDNGESFQCILTFPKEEVRHIHFIQWDKYENCLWLGTGDEDRECKLMKSIDNGDTWTVVGQGSQLWRAVGISSTEDALYWGTDAGSVPDPNYIIKMERRTYQIEKVHEVEGPCHGNAVLADETVFVSTGVEGGQNEKDKYARLRSIKYEKLEEILKKKKDIFPYILQYGVIRFPMGLESVPVPVYTTYGLVGSPECVYVGIEEE